MSVNMIAPLRAFDVGASSTPPTSYSPATGRAAKGITQAVLRDVPGMFALFG